MVQRFDGRVAFVTEDFGNSRLAARFGVTRYPAFFVGDVLVATPKDFGFFGKGEGPDEARYAPFQSVEGHAHFQRDLDRAIRLVLAGDQETAQQEAPAAADRPIPRLPEFTLTDLAGNALAAKDLAGKVVLVDFWAVWCPPCRRTLPWLAGLRQRFGDRVVIVAPAVDSDPETVRGLAAQHGDGVRWALATPDLGRAFGDVSALPTLFVFAANGATSSVHFGAPPDLHERVERELATLLRAK